MTEKPPKPGFDTMKGLKRLEEGGLDRSAAEAIVLFAEEATAHLATNARIDPVEERIDRGEERLIARIDDTSQRQTIQLGGMVIAAVFVVCGFVAWMIETRGVPPQQPAVQQAKQ